MAMAMELDGDVRRFISVLIQQSKHVFEFAREYELRVWAAEVEEEFDGESVQSDIAFGLVQWREELERGEPILTDEIGYPRAYQLLISEFSALFQRSMRMAEREGYGPIDHSLDLGEVALASLKDAVGSNTAARAFVSLLLELVKMAKAISKRLRGGW